MKRLAFLLLSIGMAIGLLAQETAANHRVTAFPQFQPARITLVNGRIVSVARANVFLKGSRLVYHNAGGKTMEARMDNIKAVDFDKRHYERIDSMLAWRVDTVGSNALYCVSKIDMASLRNNIINSRDMTNIELGNDLLNFTALDVDPESIEYPLVEIYFYRYNGRTFPVHEREIKRRIPKSKLYDYTVVTSQPTFSWTNPKSLLTLLRGISR